MVALFATIYSSIRFLFDFLRVNEATYAGLTPGQWMAILFFLSGCGDGYGFSPILLNRVEEKEVYRITLQSPSI